MVDVNTAIYSYLSGLAAVTALVADRIYPLDRDTTETTLPAITFETLTDAQGHTLTGLDGRAKATVTFSCWALANVAATDLSGSTVVGARNVAAAVVKAFNAVSGNLGGLDVHSAFAAKGPEFHDKDVGVYQVVVEVSLTYTAE